MKLSKVLEHVGYELIQGTLEDEITGIACDTEKLTGGELFVCLRGETTDGHDYVDEAVSRGAGAVAVTEKTDYIPEHITVIRIGSGRKGMAQLASSFYGDPQEKLITIGITGTKGKTSTSFMIQKILIQSGIKTGLIGTVHVDIGDAVYESVLTTPEPAEIHRYMREMLENGCQAVVMEVSSQALKMNRVHGMVFDYAVFTNIESDHIGPKEHADFDEYLRCKSKLFGQAREGIVNGDDPHTAMILQGCSCPVTTYGFGKNNNEMIKGFRSVRKEGSPGIEFNGFFVPMPGKFTAYNAMAAISVCRRMGTGDEMIAEALKNIRVPGRQECFTITGEETIVIDYAHNGMALEALIDAMRAYEPASVTVVFGCGGERDRERRFGMGRAAQNADKVIITNDNPRNECAESIFSDIINNLDNTEYTIIEDRRAAIERAVTQCMPGEAVLIAGKGHENYQIIGNRKIHLSDREEVLRSIEKVKK